MNTLTKMALGMIGQLKPQPAQGDAASALILPPPQTEGGLPLMQALRLRQSQRAFEHTPLAQQVLSDLLWAAAGINRPELDGRTTPSALNSQEIDVYVALPEGLYRYEPSDHVLYLISATDVRRVTGYEDFVDKAPLDQGRGKPRPSGRGQERLAPAASLSMRQRSISWRSAARPAASTFAHCGAVRRMERCSNLSSDGFGGLPTGFFGVSINQLSVMHKFCKSCICVIR